MSPDGHVDLELSSLIGDGKPVFPFFTDSTYVLSLNTGLSGSHSFVPKIGLKIIEFRKQPSSGLKVPRSSVLLRVGHLSRFGRLASSGYNNIEADLIGLYIYNVLQKVLYLKDKVCVAINPLS